MDNEPVREYAVIHDDLHALNIQWLKGKVNGVLDWSGVIDDRLRDVGSTIVLYHVMAPCNYPNRVDEFKERMRDFLSLYSSVFSVDSWKLEYYEAVRCFRVMVGYEIGFERVHESGMHKATYDRFTEISGIKLNKPW